MIRSARVVQRRRFSLALGTSALAWGLAYPQAAQAQCAPEPTVMDGATTCTGTDADGIRVTTPGTTLTVDDGATVSTLGGAAITAEVPNTLPFINETINVAGQVDGGAQSGITLLTGPADTYNGSTTSLALIVAAGGSVSGANALTVGQTAGSLYGELLVRIDNSGSLNGSDGVALRGDLVVDNSGYTNSFSAFGTILNQASGVIVGSVLGPVASLGNSGLIDGGSGSALAPGAAGTRYPFTIYPGAWINSGTIRSNSTAPTIISSTINTLANSGTIANAGSGAALSSSYLIIDNQAGGQISSGGTIAIGGTGSVSLVNRGTITGDVTTGDGSSLIDSAQGRINGSVVFGAGDDTLVVGYDGTSALATGVTGTIDAGGGINTEQLAVGSDTTIATPVTLLSGFQQFAIVDDPDVTTTLGTGFAAPGTIQVLGAGTLVNRAAIATPDTAFVVNGVSYPGSSRFINEGSIQTASTSAYAVIAGSSAQLVNNGSIDSAGGGVSAFQVGLLNEGTITAAGTGVMLFNSGVTNGGTIRSTGGTAVSLGGNVGTLSTNSGVIQGATVGAQLSAYLTNTGSVTATNAGGTAVQLDPYGALFNNAGGVVGSGGLAVTGTSFNESVVNAGIINGTVSLTSPVSNYGSQRYISQAGGVLNGDLVLGPDGLLFTDLDNTGPGQFAGINGSVTAASGAMLRFRVSGAQSATIGPIGPFATATYELVDGAALALSGSGTITQQVTLAGTGTVDLTADLSTTTQMPALAVVSTLPAQAGYGSPTGVLTITSHGTIAVARALGSPMYGGTGVSLGNNDTLINDGTITVTDRNGAETGRTVGIAGGSVTNNGEILLDGGIGIAANLVNSGSITEVDGGATAIGVAGGMVDNSGVIRVGGTAVTAYNGNTITNSGTIASTGGIAITGSDPSTYSSITNAAGATIAGTGGTAVRLYRGTFTNAGTVSGTVDMGYGFPYYDGAPSRSYAGSTFVAAGGTISGDLLFGDGEDLLLQTSDSLGVSGIVDGGAGTDTYGHSLSQSGVVAIDSPNVRNFEDSLVQALGTATVVTAVAEGKFNGNLYATGNGHIINQANVAGMLTTFLPFSIANPNIPNSQFPSDQTLASISNAGSIDGGVLAATASFSNSGNVGTAASQYAVYVSAASDQPFTFSNSGTIRAAAFSPDGYPETAATIVQNGPYTTDLPAVTISNNGRIDGGLLSQTQATSVTFTNSGSITHDDVRSGAVLISNGTNGAQTVTATNSGTIDAGGPEGIGLLIAANPGVGAAGTISLTNSGAIRAGAAGFVTTDGTGFISPTQGVAIGGGASSVVSITNTATGTIAAPATNSVAIAVSTAALQLANAGTITGGSGTDLSANNLAVLGGGFTTLPDNYLAGAIQTLGANDTVENSGTITGSIDLGAGNDSIDNRGTITGDVFLRSGDDRFIQHASATLVGTVDGGVGIDALTVDAAGGGTVNGDQFINFESFAQTGSGNITYTGNFNYDTIALDGGTITVAAGTTLQTSGPVAITGSDGDEAVLNYGTIVGTVALGGGNDSYTDGPGSSVGAIDGGSGTDTYVTALSGDRQGIGARTGFERLALTGNGTLGLTLDQSFDTIALTGTGLDLRLAGFTVGGIDGSDAAEHLTVDGDVARVSLGDGDDALSIAAGTLAGSYDGGTGNDRLALTASGPVTLAGTVAGFETVVLSGGALAVTGTLGSADGTVSFGGGAQALTVESGGRISGTVDLGDGDDSFFLAAGGLLQGSVSGGAGTDRATLALTADLAIGGDTLRDFETLTTTGGRTLTFGAGVASFGRIDADGGLAVAAGATLAAPQVRFGSGDDRFVITGTFAGSADGGAGANTIALSGGSAAAPIAFGGIDRFDSLAQSAGLATISGAARLGRVDLGGGRLVGLAGSTITASLINVGTGATFGSAGSVVGNIAVAGTLSPGASPGTMTVIGNISLAAGSTSLFELTPTVSDKLLLSGTLAIASGATLTLTGSRPLTPGAALDLIVASGGIAGSFSIVNQPATILGFVRQSSDRIQLFGQFDATGFNRQVTATINYVNGVLTGGMASPALIAAVPTLLTGGNATNGAAFAQLNPEAYASATQISIENGLTLAKVARGGAAATGREEAGLFTFAQGLGNWRPLDGSSAQGTSRARTNSYGALGGIGFGTAKASLGGFVGYLDSHQRIAALGDRTESDGIVAGLLGHASAAGFDLSALLAYDGRKANTRRALPDQLTSASRYHLRGWVSDTSIGYAVPLAAGWSLKPEAGLTYVSTRRGGATERGGGAFSLDVSRRKSHATFVDGAFTLQGGQADGVTFRPWISAGVRYQLNGQATLATASFAGADGGFSVLGVSRQATLATAGAGASFTLTPGVELFATYRGEFGSDGTGTNLNGGVKLRF